MNKGSKKVLIISFILALLATFILFAYSGLSKGKSNTKQINVYIAQTDLNENHKISIADVGTKSVPVEYIPENAITDKSKLIDNIVVRRISKGNYIFKDDISKIDEYTKIKIPEGKMAQSINISEVGAVSYNIKKGDHVDVVASFEENRKTKIILQNIEVISFGNESGDAKTNSKPRTVILAVNTKEAEKLAYAESFGVIKLILRRYNDGGYNNTGGVDFSTL